MKHLKKQTELGKKSCIYKIAASFFFLFVVKIFTVTSETEHYSETGHYYAVGKLW